MRQEISIDKTINGVTIWVNGIWVMDASCFRDDMCITICTKRLNEKKSMFKDEKIFKFDRRKR